MSVNGIYQVQRARRWTVAPTCDQHQNSLDRLFPHLSDIYRL